MKPEVKQFIESLQPEFSYIHIENSVKGTYVTLPYLGRVLINDTMTNFGIIQLIANSCQEQGRQWGRQELANDLKNLLQIKDDE